MMTAIEGLSWTEKIGDTSVGTIADGSAVDLYMLKDSGIKAAIITYGARIVRPDSLAWTSHRFNG